MESFSRIGEKCKILPFCPFWGSKFQKFRKWTSLSNSTPKNLSGCKVLAESEKMQNFPFLPILGVKISKCSKMDLTFKFYTQKSIRVQSFSQIGKTAKFCPFCPFLPISEVKISNISKMDLTFKFYT